MAVRHHPLEYLKTFEKTMCPGGPKGPLRDLTRELIERAKKTDIHGDFGELLWVLCESPHGINVLENAKSALSKNPMVTSSIVNSLREGAPCEPAWIAEKGISDGTLRALLCLVHAAGEGPAQGIMFRLMSSLLISSTQHLWNYIHDRLKASHHSAPVPNTCRAIVITLSAGADLHLGPDSIIETMLRLRTAGSAELSKELKDDTGQRQRMSGKVGGEPRNCWEEIVGQHEKCWNDITLAAENAEKAKETRKRVAYRFNAELAQATETEDNAAKELKRMQCHYYTQTRRLCNDQACKTAFDESELMCAQEALETKAAAALQTTSTALRELEHRAEAILQGPTSAITQQDFSRCMQLAADSADAVASLVSQERYYALHARTLHLAQKLNMQPLPLAKSTLPRIHQTTDIFSFLEQAAEKLLQGAAQTAERNVDAKNDAKKVSEEVCRDKNGISPAANSARPPAEHDIAAAPADVPHQCSATTAGGSTASSVGELTKDSAEVLLGPAHDLASDAHSTPPLGAALTMSDAHAETARASGDPRDAAPLREEDAVTKTSDQEATRARAICGEDGMEDKKRDPSARSSGKKKRKKDDDIKTKKKKKKGKEGDGVSQAMEHSNETELAPSQESARRSEGDLHYSDGACE